MRSFWMGFRDAIVEVYQAFQGIDWYDIGGKTGVLVTLFVGIGIPILLFFLAINYL